MVNCKKICLITPAHICTNPRLIKEAGALSKNGFLVHIIFSQYEGYMATEDFRLLEQNPEWTYDVLDWTKKSIIGKIRRHISGVMLKLAKMLFSFFPEVLFGKVVLNRNYIFQLRKAIGSKADLYIAHNQGSLAVAAEAAATNHSRYSFDAEDYHRGQDLESVLIKAIILIEDKYLPGALYITAASPMIAEAYEKLYKRFQPKITPILNVFPLIDIHYKNNRALPIRLFWFSQTVGLNRGIQDVIKAMKLLEGRRIEFYIYGFLPPYVASELNQLIHDLAFETNPVIYFFDPVSPDELLKLASDFDIGLALEQGLCLNYDIALTNKIFTYLAGGNAILFTNTNAQRAFHSKYQNIGSIFKSGDIEALANLIAKYDDDRNLLLEHKRNSRKLFETKLNWDLEKEVFLNKIREHLHSNNTRTIPHLAG